jgi:hypothetical protein
VKGTGDDDEGAHGQIALFQEMRTTNLIPRTSAYQIAVEKASIDTKALPSFIATPDVSAANPSGDINQLTSLVGFEMNWSGSLFPSTQNGSTIMADPVVVSSTTPTLYSFLNTGGSSLPIKYSRSSYGVSLGTVNTKKTPPAVEGILQAYIENNPNSPFWLGQFSFNLDVTVFLASFNRALLRAFGMWEAIAPVHAWLMVPTEVSPGVWTFAGRYTTAQLTGFDLSQVLIQSSVNYSQAEYDELHNLTVDFYPVNALSYVGGVNYITLPCDKKQNEFFVRYKAAHGTPPAFSASLYAVNSTYGSTVVASVSGNANTQTLPSSTQIAIATPSNVTNADNMATLTFTVTTVPSANGVAMSVPCFDFYQGISSTKIQCDDVTVTLPNQDMGPLYVNTEPTRGDFLTTAYLLGFVPDTVFNLVQTTQVVYASRPLAPAFSTRIDLASYQPLMWKPSDAYTVTTNPEPGSPYYYGYGTSYYLDNVVNPGLANCFQNEYDKYFTGDLPSVVLEKLFMFPNINALTDLSLTAQLYCTTYFNSATAPIDAVAAIAPWRAGDAYVAGTPVTFANTDPNSPINNLYIANTLTGTKDFFPPTPFKNNDYWLYCGPFMYSSAIVGGKYMDGELVTYQGYANRIVSTSNSIRTPTLFTTMFGTPLTLVPRIGTAESAATGGTVTTDGTYIYHTFRQNGNFQLTGTGSLPVQVLTVGGGGGGGGVRGGGGGGGGFASITSTTLTSANNSVVIGQGGTGGGARVPITATGGTIEVQGEWTIHTFRHDDNFTFTSLPSTGTGNGVYLAGFIVGGGGGGGSGGIGATPAQRGPGAGGGAGCVVVMDGGNTYVPYGSAGTPYSIRVGLGGAGGTQLDQQGKNGGNSSISLNATLQAPGGAGGGYFIESPQGSNGTDGQTSGNNYSCGGGGGGSAVLGGNGGIVPPNLGVGSGGQGNIYAGGGGGGCQGTGQNHSGGNASQTTGGNGGPPIETFLYISPQIPIPLGAGGGGGGATPGFGGTSVSNLEEGGRGGGTDQNGGRGTSYTGSGGGGAGPSTSIATYSGGEGGEGIVVIAYQNFYVADANGETGEPTSFNAITSPGGGGGGGTDLNGSVSNAGANGACGGGGGCIGGTAPAGGSGTNPGFNGGTSGTTGTAGGGGGFGGQGFGGGATPPYQGQGGAGVTLTLYNYPYTVCGGGGGGSNALGGAGAVGGGAGGNGYHNGQNAYHYGHSPIGPGQDSFNAGYGSGGGGCGWNGNAEDISVGGNGYSGLVVVAYTIQDYVYFGQYNLLKPTPVIGTAPPRMKLDVNPGDKGDVFQFLLDTYGFGTYDSKNPRDPIYAYARDSWGCLQSNASSFVTNRIYDEYLLFESNTAFRDMFRGFSATSERYINQLNGNTSTYWIHDFILDPSQSFSPEMPRSWLDAMVQNDALAQSSLRYMTPRSVSTASASPTSLSFLRNTDATVYYWTVASSETSRYSLWDPVQSIIIEGTTVPVNTDTLPVSEAVITQIQSLGGDSRLLLAEFFPKTNPAEGTVFYEPQFPRQIYLAAGTELKQFAYRISWRNKFTGEIVPLVLSSNGSAMVVFMFTPKN